MGSFFDKLQTAYATAYSTGLNKKFTDPKIYHGGTAFDLSKRWYVYYSYQHPTKKDRNGNPLMERQTPIYLRINLKFKTKAERLHHFRLVRETVHEMLKDGYSPYEGNSNLISLDYTAESALDFAYGLKVKELSESSIKDYKSRLSRFKRYLGENGLLERSISHIDKKVVLGYLNSVLNSSSPRNRNNTRVVLSSLFTVLENNEIIPKNFINAIKPLNSKPERNKTYDIATIDGLYNFMEQKDPIMLFFVKLVSYNFLRPIEVCRIQVKDINLQQKLLYVKAKNKLVKTKIIPDLMLSELEGKDFSNANDFLVTPNGVGPWDAAETNRRDYFSKRFKKNKEAYNKYLLKQGSTFQLGKDHTIYSFRHTFITKLFRELRRRYSKSETLDRLMLVTGHSTIKALMNYLRDIDAELPQDYSEFLK